MASFLVIAISFMLIICGNVESAVGQDLFAMNTSTASSKCVKCCNDDSAHARILNRIVSRQDREMQSLVEIENKVVDDIPSELDKLSADLDSVKKMVINGIPSALKRQSASLSGIEAMMLNLLDRIETLSTNLTLLDNRLKMQERLMHSLSPDVKEIQESLVGPKDCSDISALGNTTSGIYRVYPGSLAKRIQVDVYCDMTTPGGNWLVFQRRKDGSVNFEETWDDYATGFGNATGEFWLGNELLYLLTSNRKYKLRIDLEDFDGQKRYAEFSTFSISAATDRYRLTVSGYTGDAGDSFTKHNGMQFSTKDADNDVYKEGSCSLKYHGGWWYASCHASNLNGLYLGGPHTSYADGVDWYYFRGDNYSLKTTEMKIAVAE